MVDAVSNDVRLPMENRSCCVALVGTCRRRLVCGPSIWNLCMVGLVVILFAGYDEVAAGT